MKRGLTSPRPASGVAGRGGGRRPIADSAPLAAGLGVTALFTLLGVTLLQRRLRRAHAGG